MAKGKDRSIGPMKKGDWKVDHVRSSSTKGRDVWRVSSGDTVKTITTRKASTKAMNEAVVIYGRALKRLADR